MDTEAKITELETKVAEAETAKVALTSKLTETETRLQALTAQATEAETAKAQAAQVLAQMEAAKTKIADLHKRSFLVGVSDDAAKFAPAVALGDDWEPTPESASQLQAFRELLARPAGTPPPTLPRLGGDGPDEDEYWRKMRTDPAMRREWVLPETQKKHAEYLRKKHSK